MHRRARPDLLGREVCLLPSSPTDNDQPQANRSGVRDPILLDDRIPHLLEPLVQAEFVVTLVNYSDRLVIPLRRKGMAPRPPVLVTAAYRDWIAPGASPMTLGCSLVNVRPILDHPDGCAAVLLRALTCPIPDYSMLMCDFDPCGKHHLVLFVTA